MFSFRSARRRALNQTHNFLLVFGHNATTQPCPRLFVANDFVPIFFVWGGSKQNDFLLELEDLVRVGQISAGAGRLIYFNMSAAE